MHFLCSHSKISKKDGLPAPPCAGHQTPEAEEFAWLLNEYFETISFAQGAQFNVSHAIDTDYINKLHWHPFVEILVSLAEGNAVSVNFCRYELGINDILLLYPGDLHSIEGGSTNAYLIIQFPNELFTVMNELRDQAGLFPATRTSAMTAQAARRTGCWCC